MSPWYALAIVALLPLPTELIGRNLAQKGPNFLFPPQPDPTARLLTGSTGTPDRTVPDKDEPVLWLNVIPVVGGIYGYMQPPPDFKVRFRWNFPVRSGKEFRETTTIDGRTETVTGRVLVLEKLGYTIVSVDPGYVFILRPGKGEGEMLGYVEDGMHFWAITLSQGQPDGRDGTDLSSREELAPLVALDHSSTASFGEILRSLP
jgi:hypothetical protein